MAHNALARVVCRALRSACATESRVRLHWLPMRQRIGYKLALLTHKTKSTGTPSYVASLLESYCPVRQLRSSIKNLLTVPKSRLKTQLFILAYG